MSDFIIIERLCVWCKEPISSRRKSQRFCGRICAGRHRFQVHGNPNKNKPIFKSCERCGNTFKAQKKSRFCGNKCASEQHSIDMIGVFVKPIPESVCKACHKTFKPTRHRGRSVPQYCSVQCNMSQLHTEDVEVARRNGFVKSKKTGKFESNIHARNFQLRAPNGVDYTGRNISEFVRTHTQLFPKKYLSLNRNGRTRASEGLRALRPSDNRKKQLMSWHGWTWISILDRRFDDGNDPLRRTDITETPQVTPSPQEP